MPGATRAARCARTASLIDEVTQKRLPKVSTAHSMMLSAGASSSSGPTTRAVSRSSSALTTVIEPLRSQSGAADRRTSPRRRAGTPGTPMRRVSRRAGRAARHRSRGSAEERSGRSSQRLLVCARSPRSEALARSALVEVPPDDSLDVVGKTCGGDLVGSELAAESGVEAKATAEVDLKALDLVAGLVEDELALQP